VGSHGQDGRATLRWLGLPESRQQTYNGQVNEPPPPTAPAPDTTQRLAPARLDPALAGLGCCVFSAIAYTIVNALLRDLSVRCDQVWILAIKETMTVLVLGPWLLWQSRQGRTVLPGRRAIVALAAAGLGTQLVGNLSALWAISRIGLSIAVPLMSGVNLLAGAALSWVFLGERVSRLSAVAIGLLLAAVVLVSQGAPAANRSIAATAEAIANDPSGVALGILAALAAGVTYAVLSVVIRRNVTQATRPTAVVFLVTLMGTVSVGPLGLLLGGPEALAAMTPTDVAMTMTAGAINLVAFVAVTKGLQLTAVARVNVVMASQVAMGALVGMVVFREPASSWLAVGVSLTIAGMILIGRKDNLPDTPETPI